MSIMRNAGRWAVNKEWSDRDLEEAKISVFQAVDAPKAVNQEGMGKFLSGITEEMQTEEEVSTPGCGQRTRSRKRAEISRRRNRKG
ncbi:Mitochondrial presequence protease [Metarhizium acridum]|nr:Mitochondrial presequence protease [Metarhizium acridum]